MRWIWIDQIVAFETGRRASAVKNVTLAEEHLHDHFPGYPVMPPSLMIEGMAQTAGILVGEARHFKENVVLAKVRTVEFAEYAGPGDQLRYDAEIETLDDRAGVTAGLVSKNGRSIGRVDLIFSHLDRADRTMNLPEGNFVFTGQFLNLLSAFRSKAVAESESTHGG